MKTKIRYWQIDAARGTLVIGMILYHLVFDIDYLFGSNILSSNSYIEILARMIAAGFLLLVGVSASLRFSQGKGFLKRIVWISLWAVSLSLITYIFFPDQAIVFGILHLIAVSLVLLVPFLRINNEIIWLVAIGLLAVAPYLKRIMVSSWLLIPIGFNVVDFASLDYFPVVPWFSFVLIGLIIGRWWTTLGIKTEKVSHPLIGFISGIGANSLMIYLLHQPIIFGLLKLIKMM